MGKTIQLLQYKVKRLSARKANRVFAALWIVEQKKFFFKEKKILESSLCFRVKSYYISILCRAAASVVKRLFSFKSIRLPLFSSFLPLFSLSRSLSNPPPPPPPPFFFLSHYYPSIVAIFCSCVFPSTALVSLSSLSLSHSNIHTHTLLKTCTLTLSL